jgi:uncharacterized protein
VPHSPYLETDALQHAHNPVDWMPWGDAAFDKAKSEDKPVFLSIGYATCHWCHVMERESFAENEKIAEYLNENFCQHQGGPRGAPDIDAVYMAVCQMATGSGGWPLSIFMTPERKPFFAATYLPKRSRFGRMGLIELCEEGARSGRSRRSKIAAAAEEITARLGRAFEFSAAEAPGMRLLDRAYEDLALSFDARHGGFESCAQVSHAAPALLSTALP